MNTHVEKDGHRRVRRDALKTRELILKAAEKSFIDKGFKATAIADLADALGMSPANVFKHFNSKTALAQAVVETRLQRDPTICGAEPAERVEFLLREILRIVLAFWRDEPNLFALMENLMACGEIAGQFIKRMEAHIRSALNDPENARNSQASAEILADVFLAVLHPSIVVSTDEEVLQKRTENLIKFTRLALAAS